MRDWMFSSVMSGCPAGEERLERLDVLGKKIVDGDGGIANTEVFRQRAGIVNRAGGRILAGHADGGHILFAQGVDRDGGHQRRIDASAQGYQHLGKAAFADVVAGA